MSLEFEVPLFSLIFIVFLLYVYFSKPKIKIVENKYYSFILIFSTLAILADTLVHFLCSIVNDYNTIVGNYYYIINYANKVIVTFYAMVIALLCAYIFIISYDKVRNNIKRVNTILIAFGVLLFTSLFFTNIEIVKVGYVFNVVGTTPILGYAIIAVLLLISLVVTLINIKKNDKRYTPILFIIPFIGVFYVLTILVPGIIIYDLIFALLCYIMYFTIENPDIRLIEQLNIAKEQAEKANMAKTDFLSSMSHEIRTPLNAIVGFSQALLEENLPEEAESEVKDIIMASDSLIEIVNGILDISKIEANKLEIINTEYNFKKIFDDLVKLTKARLGDKPLDFRVSYDESIPNVLYGDHSRIKQIVLNLLTNSVKYTKKGYIDFKVNSIIKNNVCRLFICVEDSGIGIKKENIDKLFTKFERLEVEKNTTTEGTGLGLAITKKLVELMNGKIIVQSVENEGSKFVVLIDQSVVLRSTNNTEKETIIVESKNLDFSNKKVLLVDDNTINLKVAERLLKSFKVNVTTSLSGFECLDKINNGDTYDLILLDDMMPKMSGVETLAKLKSIQGFNIPVVALTANAISGMKEKYIADGFDDYLSKPIVKEELSQVVNRYLSK